MGYPIKCVIHSEDIPKPYRLALENIFTQSPVVVIPRNEDLYDSIASHPDIFIFDAGEGLLVYSASLPDETISLLKKYAVSLRMARTIPAGRYPGTIPLNAVRVGKRVFHNIEYTDISIRDLAKEEGLDLVDVNQGYARCSTIPVGKNALITADSGIGSAAKKAGIDVLMVRPGNVLLPGQKHGFIGGASGVMPGGDIIFLGGLETHPDHIDIRSFIRSRGLGFVDIPGLPLFDAGSLIFA